MTRWRGATRAWWENPVSMVFRKLREEWSALTEVPKRSRNMRTERQDHSGGDFCLTYFFIIFKLF